MTCLSKLFPSYDVCQSMIDQWKSSNGCIRVVMSRNGMIIHGTKVMMKKVRFHPIRQVVYLTEIHPYIEVEEKINQIKSFLVTLFKHKIKAVKERQHSKYLYTSTFYTKPRHLYVIKRLEELQGA